jgi:hypothetical protein
VFAIAEFVAYCAIRFRHFRRRSSQSMAKLAKNGCEIDEINGNCANSEIRPIAFKTL